jgi:hypothetical protein
MKLRIVLAVLTAATAGPTQVFERKFFRREELLAKVFGHHAAEAAVRPRDAIICSLQCFPDLIC